MEGHVHRFQGLACLGRVQPTTGVPPTSRHPGNKSHQGSCVQRPILTSFNPHQSVMQELRPSPFLRWGKPRQRRGPCCRAGTEAPRRPTLRAIVHPVSTLSGLFSPNSPPGGPTTAHFTDEERTPRGAQARQIAKPPHPRGSALQALPFHPPSSRGVRPASDIKPDRQLAELPRPPGAATE